MTLELFGIILIIILAIVAGFFIFNYKKFPINIYLYDIIPSLFPSLGIFFTFLGIALGFQNFDVNNIEKSIPELINGLKTAFSVSLLGVFFLLVFSVISNFKKKKIVENILSQETLAIQKLTEVLLSLQQDFQSQDENGNIIKPGNMIRDLYEESRKQSNSLQSFSTDLATTISAGFEQIINNPAEGVVAELRLVRNEIENLGKKLQDPATDMTQSIVKDLQESLKEMIVELQKVISGNTKDELEKLAFILGQAGGALSNFPEKLELMMDSLNQQFLNVQKTVDEIKEQTSKQSSEAAEKMKEQIEAATKMVEDILTKLKEKDIANGEVNEKNQKITASMLGALHTNIEKLNELSVNVTTTTEKLIKAQQNLEQVILAFRSISQEVNSSTARFGESQVTFSRYSNEFLENNSETIQEIQETLETAKKVADDYANKFGIIEKGLQNVFQEVNTGLKDYQSAVSTSLSSFLGTYTENLTKTAEALEGASSKQEDILEELTEQISKLNGGRK